jgi:hypothetical protein
MAVRGKWKVTVGKEVNVEVECEGSSKQEGKTGIGS